MLLSRKQMIADTRDIMARAGVGEKIIDGFLSEVHSATTSEVAALCNGWRGKLGAKSAELAAPAKARVVPTSPNLSPEAAIAACPATTVVQCERCAEFLECVDAC